MTFIPSRPTRRRCSPLVAVAAAFLATAPVGCGPGFEAQAPAGFVDLGGTDVDDERYDWRATNADGLVLAVRELPHEPSGEASFWLAAIKKRMQQRVGYALLEERAVRTADGVAGTQLRFGHDEASGRPHLYYLSVFVTEDAIFLVEAGGTKALMTQHDTEVEQMVTTFRTR
ncbi:MAG: serine/threonine protein kinase [Myxococcota bacterium]